VDSIILFPTEFVERARTFLDNGHHGYILKFKHNKYSMKLSRRSRFVAVLIALFSMLFMQLAVASCACSAMTIGLLESMSASADADNRSMPGCEGMDMGQSKLCHAHDQAGKQSPDKSELPNIQPFVAASLALVFRNIEAAYDSIAIRPRSAALTRTTAPPIPIRNCCFRI
jgi:hypothetical protein